jgi:hypothetical protein
VTDKPSFQPIETAYAGHLFRSRLEARWAVFMDHLGVQWRYEPQGYVVGTGEDTERYLPDFRLPEVGVWVEVKGAANERDLRVLTKAAHPVELGGLEHNEAGSGARILILSDVPYVDTGAIPLHQTMWWNSERAQVEIALSAWGLGKLVPFLTPWAARTADPRLLTESPSLWLGGGHFGSKVLEAYDAARTARFEWGQTP